NEGKKCPVIFVLILPIIPFPYHPIENHTFLNWHINRSSLNKDEEYHETDRLSYVLIVRIVARDGARRGAHQGYLQLRRHTRKYADGLWARRGLKWHWRQAQE